MSPKMSPKTGEENRYHKKTLFLSNQSENKLTL